MHVDSTTGHGLAITPSSTSSSPFSSCASSTSSSPTSSTMASVMKTAAPSIVATPMQSSRVTSSDVCHSMNETESISTTDPSTRNPSISSAATSSHHDFLAPPTSASVLQGGVGSNDNGDDDFFANYSYPNDSHLPVWHGGACIEINDEDLCFGGKPLSMLHEEDDVLGPTAPEQRHSQQSQSQSHGGERRGHHVWAEIVWRKEQVERDEFGTRRDGRRGRGRQRDRDR